MERSEIRVLLRQLSTDETEAGWKLFLESYSGLIHQVAGLFEREWLGIRQ